MTFVKGKSGNPGGRPKNPWTLRGLYLKELEKPFTTTDGKKIQGKNAMVKKVVRKAVIEGDLDAVQEISNRLEGKPKQQTDVTSKGEQIRGVVILPAEEDGDE